MSRLEDKLSASIQNPRRGGAKSGGGETAEKGTEKPAPADAEHPTKGATDIADLNAGQGRALNPPRIWPD